MTGTMPADAEGLRAQGPEHLVERARAGDRRAFDDLVAPHRAELRRFCYRMLGTPEDAEDAVQETLLAAWRAVGSFEGRASPRTWLYRIATRRCLNAARTTARRRPAAPQPPFPVPVPSRRDAATWWEPVPDVWLAGEPSQPEGSLTSRETVEAAFVAALQAVPPRQAAALVLHDVLGYDLAETADLIGAEGTAAKGLLQRARAGVRARVPAGAAPPRGSLDEARVARRFAEAFVGDDIGEMLALLTDDAWLAMPPAPHVYVGRRDVRAFLAARAAHRDLARTVAAVPTRANGGPAFGWYVERPGDPAPVAAGIVVLTLRGDRVARVTRCLGPRLVGRFGLPETL